MCLVIDYISIIELYDNVREKKILLEVFNSINCIICYILYVKKIYQKLMYVVYGVILYMYQVIVCIIYVINW